MIKIVHRQHGQTGYMFELDEESEALELLVLLLQKEPGQYYMRKI